MNSGAFEQPLKAASLMRDFAASWFIAGGWAIDLFLGKQTRAHDDVEIAMFRRDQLALQKYLCNWNLKKVESGAFSAWRQNEFLELPVHEIHCFNENEERFLEILLNESDGEQWIFRRNFAVTKPIRELFSTTDSGMNFLRPEVVLLYKSKNPRAKDERDFQKALKHLDSESKEWLKNALSICYSEHRWLENL